MGACGDAHSPCWPAQRDWPASGQEAGRYAFPNTSKMWNTFDLASPSRLDLSNHISYWLARDLRMEHSGNMDMVSPPDQLDIIFYDPSNPSSSSSNKQKDRPRWQKLADRIGIIKSRALATKRLDIATLLGSYQPSNVQNGTPIAFAYGFARNIHASEPEVAVRELLLVSLCSVLSTSGRAVPEELDAIMNIVLRSKSPKYLDRVKRGAKLANELIAEWALATTSIQDPIRRLDRATQAILQGTYIFYETF